jgi:thiamine monophosphate kinase
LLAVCTSLGCDPVRIALGGGEDYALLGTCAPSDVPRGFRVIGSCELGAGVWLRGSKERVDVPGHDHFRTP